MLDNIIEGVGNNVAEGIADNMLDYFRGGSSYEDAVKKRLNVLGAAGIATTVAVSNMKSEVTNAINSNTNEIQGLRSDIQAAAVGLYNQGQGIRNDIQNMALGVTTAIQESTYAIVASQAILAENFKQGFNAVNNTLDFGFSLVGNKIDVLSEEISSKLDEIHDILNNPRLTESRELYREALRSYQKGYFEEALEDCKGAVEKNKTDFISWYLLGMIYLFGAGKFSNVIDIDKAEESFFNAAKYIDSDLGQSKEANLFASEIYYYLGYTRLVKSNDYLIEGNTNDSNQKLIEAEKASATAYKLSDDNMLAKYEHAKELHFLEKDDEALTILQELILKEKNYAIKALNDKNFESLWDDIKLLIEKMRQESIQIINEGLEDFFKNILYLCEVQIELYTAMIEENPRLNYTRKQKLINELPPLREQYIEYVNQYKGEIQQKYAKIENKDYFSLLDLREILYTDLENFNNTITLKFKTYEDMIKNRISVQLEVQEEEEWKRKREIEERREAEEKKRKEEEKKRKEEEKRREEEEKRRRAEERRRIAESKNRRYRIEFLILCITMFSIQWGNILYFNIAEILYVLYGIAAIGMAFSPLINEHYAFGGDDIFENIMILVLGTSTSLSFYFGYATYGWINLIVTAVYGLTFLINSGYNLFDPAFSPWIFWGTLSVSFFFIYSYSFEPNDGICMIAFLLSFFAGFIGSLLFIILGIMSIADNVVGLGIFMFILAIIVFFVSLKKCEE